MPTADVSTPLSWFRDFSAVPLGKAVAETEAALTPSVSRSPVVAAAEFYGLYHARAEVVRAYQAGERPVAGADILRLYEENAAASVRAVYHYLLTTTLRESRHAKGLRSKRKAAFLAKYADLYEWWSVSVNGKCEVDAVEALVRKDALPAEIQNVPLGRYLAFIRDTFRTHYFNAQYGGWKWAGIVEALQGFVSGRLSGELFLDRAFALAHNTTSVFNKGYMFSAFEPKHLQVVLDVQRAGQVPSFLFSPNLEAVSSGKRAEVELAQRWLMPPTEEWGQRSVHPKVVRALRAWFGVGVSAVDWVAVSASAEGSIVYAASSSAFSASTLGRYTKLSMSPALKALVKPTGVKVGVVKPGVVKPVPAYTPPQKSALGSPSFAVLPNVWVEIVTRGKAA